MRHPGFALTDPSVWHEARVQRPSEARQEPCVLDRACPPAPPHVVRDLVETFLPGRVTTPRDPASMACPLGWRAWWARRPGRHPSRRAEKAGSTRGPRPGRIAGAMTRARTVGIPRLCVPSPGLGSAPCPHGGWLLGGVQARANRGPGRPAVRRARLDAHAVDARCPLMGWEPRWSSGALDAAPPPSTAGAVVRGMPRPPGPFEARQRAHGAGAGALCPGRGRLRSPRGVSCGTRGGGLGPSARVRASDPRRRSFWPAADGCPPCGTLLGLPSRRPVDSAPRGRPMPCRPAPPPRHRRVPDARGVGPQRAARTRRGRTGGS